MEQEKSRQEIIAEIERNKKLLAELEQEEKNSLKNETIKKLSEYTIEEKVAKFDTMYNSALNELEELEKSGYSWDNVHYAWENYIEILSKDKNKFWKYWNSLFK